MKTIFATTLLLISSAPALGQADSRDREPQHHEWIGLLGLAGLAGLAGLRRPKNPDHERFAESGVNVKSVKV
jgi:hypothetical protein